MQTTNATNWNTRANRKARKPSSYERQKPSHVCMGKVEWKKRPRFRKFKFIDVLLEGKRGWPDYRRGHRVYSGKRHHVITKDKSLEQSPAELEFERQREAFNKIPASELARYQGRFVAVRDGVIVDSDYDPIELSRRFFERYGGVPVYKTRIGEPMVVNIPAPFLR
jgi:hypothetical protein